MKCISLISDTHGHLSGDILKHCEDADEIWHAGDIGKPELLDQLQEMALLRAVYGNIDGMEIRLDLGENLHFECEGLKVFMTHIGGYPGRYTRRVWNILRETKPDICVCGHSHILKIIYDRKMSHLHLNPGACGIQGVHKIRTLIKFELNAGKIENMRVVELGLRGRVVK